MNCTSTRQYVPLADQAQEIEDPSKGRIYVLRPTGVGSAVSMQVEDGNQLIGKTGPQGCLCWEREPGATEIVGQAENRIAVPLDVKQGTVYFILQQVRMGVLMARNNLLLLTDDEGRSTLAKCRPPEVDPTP